MNANAKIARLKSRAVIALRGEDHCGFLQGLVSNDTKLAEQGQAFFTALLTPQGKYNFDFIVKPEGDVLLIDCEADRAEEFLTRLAAFRLRTKIEFQNVSESRAVYACWENHCAHPQAFQDPRLAALGARLILSISEKVHTNATEADYRHHRYLQGVAEGHKEIALNNATLLEVNFDFLNGVSFTKGCYMGQELTARTHYRGLVKRRYLPFTFDGITPEKHHILTHGGFEIGEVKAIEGDAGLGLFNLVHVKPFIGNGNPLVCDGALYKIYVPDYLKAAFAKAA
jgi:folate-binding protein YgfZ